MSPRLKQLTEQALKLSDDDKFTLIDAISNSVKCPFTNIDKIWLEESERRSESFDKGETTSRDAFEALKEISKKFASRKK